MQDPHCPVEAIREPAEGPDEEGGAGPGLVAVGGPVGSAEHCYCQCARIIHIWNWIKRRCLASLGLADCLDSHLLFLQHPRGGGAMTVTWLISSYLEFVWMESRRGSKLLIVNLTSFLAQRVRKARNAGFNVGFNPG